VLDVPDDGDPQPVEAADAAGEVLADRVAVEQGLGRVLVRAVAAVMMDASSRARRWGAQTACRITTTSGCMDCRVRPVSFRLSPFTTLLAEVEMLITSALSHLPAISNEVRVRVLGS
jgi:hypothetical protein